MMQELQVEVQVHLVKVILVDMELVTIALTDQLAAAAVLEQVVVIPDLVVVPAVMVCNRQSLARLLTMPVVAVVVVVQYLEERGPLDLVEEVPQTKGAVARDCLPVDLVSLL